MSQLNVLDEAALARLHKLGGAGFVRKMLELFLDYGPQRIVAAQTAAAAQDLSALAKAVHPLKSSAGQIGAQTVADLAAQLEAAAQAGTSDTIPGLLDRLATAVTEVNVQLEQKLKEPQ